jgi:hypothetical protein
MFLDSICLLLPSLAFPDILSLSCKPDDFASGLWTFKEELAVYNLPSLTSLLKKQLLPLVFTDWLLRQQTWLEV